MGKPKIVIVGGVAGDASAPAKVPQSSEDAEIIMFEKGPDIAYANCGLPYYLSGVIEDRGKLAKDRETVVYFASGLRSYLATRIFMQRGFTRVKNLTGGTMSWVYHLEKAGRPRSG